MQITQACPGLPCQNPVLEEPSLIDVWGLTAARNFIGTQKGVAILK